jgi:hypothetical protein
MRTWIVWAVLGFLANSATATPGGMDRYGCHESKAGYHCHKMKLEKIKDRYDLEDQAQRARRLQAQCRGLPNRGVCFGYSDGQPVPYN